jgi:sulfite exporter TauE/SafE
MLAEFARQCGLAFASNGNIILTLFLGALVGSVTHCVGMCGPFVITQAATRLQKVPKNQSSEWRRLRGAALLPYHAGRLTTYTLLGVLAATLLQPASHEPWFGGFAASALFLAGMLFMLQALRQCGLVFPRLHLAPLSLPSWAQPMLQRLFAAPIGWRGYLLGVALGFLPCGLVYAALLAVAAKGEPLTALLGMAAFALGTIPILVLTGLGGHYVTARWPRFMRYGAAVVMGANAVVLWMLAGGIAK